jgi:hypothetical protein
MGGAATAVAIGASTGTTTVNNALAVTGDTTLTGDLGVNGGDITTTATTFNLVNATATTLSIGSAASTARLGATSGTLTLGNPTVVGTQTTQNLWNTTATTINFGQAATTMNIGAASSGAAVNVGKDLYVAGNLYVTGTQSTGSISTISGADSAIYTNAGNAGNTREIGLIGTYVSSGTKYTGVLRDHTDSVWKFYSTSTAPVAGTTQDFTGTTYDVIKHGGSIYAGSTSGTISVNATAIAGSNTLVLPAASDTLIGKATTDILTNKTYDTAGTGNVLKINGTQVSDITGTGKVVLDTLPTFGTTGIKLSGSSSGTTTVVATAAASGSLILPAASDTLVGKATTDTFTNKTFNTAGTGNSFSINSNAITGYTGTGATVVLSAAPTITGHPTIEGVTSTGATGTGAFVFASSPSLTTPTLGVASATSVNKLTITTPATSATLTIADGTTLSTAGSVSHAGAYSQTFTATANTSLTLPTTGTLATLAGSETLTNKTLSSAVLTGTLTAGGGVGTNGQYLQSTATGVQWATLSGTISLAAGSGSGSVSTGGTLTLTGGTGITTSASTSTITITNSGVTSVSAGTGVTLGATTGACSISIGQAVATTSNVTFGTIASGALTVTGAITATTSITSYYSDDRLKTRTGNIQNALEKVLSLDGFHYHANETAVALGYDASKEEVGLSAQQVQKVLPEVIAPAPIDPQYMTMHYERLVPLLVEAIKEQQKQIEELKAKLGN